MKMALGQLEDWMKVNRLKLNQGKTQFMWIGRKEMINKLNREDLHSHFPDMKFLSSVNNLGVVLDERLEMEEQFGSICRSGFYHLRQIRGISPFLERRGSPVGSTGVYLVEGRLLQLRSPGIERHHGRPRAALDESRPLDSF